MSEALRRPEVDYGSEEAAMQAYLKEGERRAFALGNRGPVRYTADGRIDPAILDAYWRCGFYVFEGVLKPDELAGGTFTLTNTGSRGALFDTPVVFLPQVAILGTGIVTKKPAVVMVDGQEAIAVRSMVYLALSYDHRIVDGADAARFLTAVKERLEEADFSADLGI